MPDIVLKTFLIALLFSDITKFIQQQMRERNEKLPPEDSLLIARRIKEKVGIHRLASVSYDIAVLLRMPRYRERVQQIRHRRIQVYQERGGLQYEEPQQQVGSRCCLRALPWARGKPLVTNSCYHTIR